jgi:ABC-2 type transport system permease protein
VDANAVNATKGMLGSQYIMRTIASALSEVAAENGLAAAAADSDLTSVRYFYNETLDYRFYMIPAFIIILIQLVCCFISGAESCGWRKKKAP